MKYLRILLAIALIAFGQLAHAAFRSAATSENPSGTPTTSFTATAPAGVQAGDILVGVISLDNSSGLSLAFPTGWTQVRSDHVTNGDGQTTSLGWKVATGSDSYAFTYTTTTESCGVSIAAYTGRNTGTPNDVTPSGNNPNPGSVPNSPVSVVASGVTTVQNGDDIVYLGAIDANTVGGGTWTAPSGMTLRTSNAGGTTFEPTAIADLNQGTAGATGNQTGTWTNSGDNGNFIGYLLALAPAPSATTTGASIGLMFP